jgi:hypothetical protein
MLQRYFSQVCAWVQDMFLLALLHLACFRVCQN